MYYAVFVKTPYEYDGAKFYTWHPVSISFSSILHAIKSLERWSEVFKIIGEPKELKIMTEQTKRNHAEFIKGVKD